MRFIRLSTLFALVCLAVMGSVQPAPANAETLRMIIWEGYFPEAHRAKFIKWVKQKHGVDLTFEVTYVTDAQEFYHALLKKKTDMISPTHNLINDQRFNFIKKKLLLPINLDNVPNFKNLMPGLKEAAYHSSGGKVYAVPYANGPYGLAYNSGKLSAPPTTWKVLLDPRYSKKYTVVEDYFEVNVYIAALMAGIPPGDLTDYNAVNKPRVVENLRTLRMNSGPFWNGVDKVSDLKGHTLATSWGFSFAGLAEQGETWKFAEPVEGSPWWVDNFAVGSSLADKPGLRRIAEELINYLISPEFQLENVIDSLSAVPVNTATPLTEEQQKAFHMDDDAETFVKRRILWPTLSERARNGFARMWKNAGK